MTFLFYSLLAPLALAAVSFDVTDPAELVRAARLGANQLIKYYPPNPSGAIPESGASDETGIQWYESGIMWGALMQTARITKDGAHIETISGALANASFGEAASFLGGQGGAAISGLFGKWNDDILWWSFGAATGAQIFGAGQRMPNGVRFLDVANTTFFEVMDQWSTDCGGGVYWARNRNAAQANQRLYKSTISNAQMMELAGRMYLLTRNKFYLDVGDRVWQWMRSSNLVADDGSVYDGITAVQGCPINSQQISYKSGTTLGGLGWLFRASGNQAYIDAARPILRRFVQQFTVNGVITDPCEPNCADNQVQPKGTAIRGLMYLYESTDDSEIRTTIARIVRQSLLGMLQTCSQDMGCYEIWTGSGMREYTNVHTQLAAIELLNAASLITPQNIEGQGTLVSPKVTGTTKGTGSNDNSSAVSSFAAIGSTFLAAIVSFALAF